MPSPQTTTLTPSPSVPTINSSYFVPADEDEEEPGFTEIQTVALACFLTLLPLMFGLVSYFGFRFLCREPRKSRRAPFQRPYVLYCWGRLKRSVEPSDIGKVLDKECAQRNRSSHALLNEQLKASESQFSMVPPDDAEDPSVLECDEEGFTPVNQTSKATANGSIITMTMKNNHLIVETEVTEDSATGLVPQATAEDVGYHVVNVEMKQTAVDDSRAIIHHASDDVQNEKLPANTGLSTSDLSCSSDSLAAQNRGYSYGNQSEYVVDNLDGELSCQSISVTVQDSQTSNVSASPPPSELPTSLIETNEASSTTPSELPITASPRQLDQAELPTSIAT